MRLPCGVKKVLVVEEEERLDQVLSEAQAVGCGTLKHNSRTTMTTTTTMTTIMAMQREMPKTPHRLVRLLTILL